MLGNHDEIFFAHTGVGTEEAAITATALMLQIEPDMILMCGTAGGIDPSLNVGDLVISQQITHIDMYSLPTLWSNTPFASALIDPNTHKPSQFSWKTPPEFFALCEATEFLRLYQGHIVVTNTFPAPAELFNQILALNAQAIEMESAGICKAAARMNSKVNPKPVFTATIRVISNLLDSEGKDCGTPEHGMELCSQRLSAFLLKLLRLLFSHQNRFNLAAKAAVPPQFSLGSNANQPSLMSDPASGSVLLRAKL